MALQVSLLNLFNTSLSLKWYRQGLKSEELGEEGDYIYSYQYIHTTRMTPALRQAAMRAILMFHNCGGQSHKTVSTNHNI